MRGLVAALCAVLVSGTIVATASAPAGAKEAKEFTVGQWAGFVFSDDNTGQLIDCTAWAFNSDNIRVGISVNKAWNLDLWLTSDAWDLPANQSYPISYWIDRNQINRGKAATDSSKFVKIEVERDQAVFDELRIGSQLTFRTQSDDYVFNLRGSNAALNRLLDCVDRYSKTASANPFGGGSASENPPQDNDQQQSSQQQSGDSGSSSQGASGGAAMASFTLTAAEVRQFLVDVTGAKPSMIAVGEKTDKNGAPYYELKTPLGDGQFWQEKLAGRDLGGLASSYIEGYKADCSGNFEPVVNDPVRGDHGMLATGGAACSASKYQDNGPEYLSYAVLESEGVVSFYMTYVGGNAAKAKSDSLGKLIARRSEDLIQ